MKYFNSFEWYDNIEDISIDNMPFVKYKKDNLISNIPIAFDIESTSFYNEKQEKQAIMYAWVLGINGKCIRGRTWNDFIKVIEFLVKKYELNDKKRLIIYVHNLSFEFQFIRKIFKWSKVFSIEERKPIYAITTSGIEFRCSYLLSGYNLATLGKNLNKYKVNKLVGDLDYKLLRHSKTPLTIVEWKYILNDVLVVTSYIQELIEQFESIANIPITKTGFVRLLLKKNCLKKENRKNYHALIKTLQLEEESFNLMRKVYSGGFTHANANHVNKTKYNVSSVDFTSAYPYCLISEKYPMSTPRRYYIKNKQDFKEVLTKYACIFTITFYDIESKISFENYISSFKCEVLENEIINNGRVVSATKLKISICELDYKIIEKAYNFNKIEITNFYIMKKEYLPRPFILTILELYQKKTILKGVEDKQQEYMNAKENLNSLYGMCATNPLREEIEYIEEWNKHNGDIEKLLLNYNKGANRTNYYAWGIYNTAYNRYNLWLGILECKEDYIYSDTDSLKILNYEYHKKFFDEYNKNTQLKLKRCLDFYNIPLTYLTPKTIKGIEKPLGVFDYEGTYTRFKTLGAKRYIYEEDKQLHITISGVNKKNGVEYLLYKYKTLDKVFDNFKTGLYFPSVYKDKNELKNASGKMIHTYIDEYICGTMIDYKGVSCYYQEYSSVHLENTSYELSLATNFINYLLGKKGDEYL